MHINYQLLLSKQEQDLFNKKLGETIKTARMKADIKQEDLSRHLGFKSRISVANIENGKQNVQLTTLLEIANYLKLSITDLIPPLETVKKGINPEFIENIEKQVVDDPRSVEKLIEFVRFTTLRK